MMLRKRHLRCCLNLCVHLLFICKYCVQPISGFQTLLKSNAYGRGPRIRNYYKLKNEIYRQSTVTLHALPDIHLPDLTSLNEVSRQLTEALDIGADFLQDSEDGMATMTIPEAETSAVLESMGQDLLIFLTSSVVVTLISNSIVITPILGYLVAGALLGPHGLDVFSNAKADVELGDFGILFLLFSEGLEVSSARLEKLTNYLPLGFAQISLTTGVITAAILAGAPQFLDRFLPLDEVSRSGKEMFAVSSLTNLCADKELLLRATLTFKIQQKLWYWHWLVHYLPQHLFFQYLKNADGRVIVADKQLHQYYFFKTCL